MLYAFLEAAKDPAIGSIDAFVYDVDEPNFVSALVALSQTKPLRVILDNSKEKGKPKPDRTDFAEALTSGNGKVDILRTCFKRFAHDKVLILRDASGKATSVLCGSANFSIRGLYVQGNSVIVIDDADVAGTYELAFDTAWQSTSTFSAQPIASNWYNFRTKPELPDFSVSFAPHENGEAALKAAETAVSAAEKVVVFALMSPGGGNLIVDLEKLASNDKVFTFGVLQTEAFATQLMQGGAKSAGAKVQNEISSFTPLATLVPKPFLKEFSGGMGQVIHHKFVVVDFNGADPVVFCGSSNLTSGGESANGDNLLAIHDREIATLYAIEGIRLADHYSFRDKLKSATKAAPMALQGPGETPPWYADYYVAGTPKCRSRVALIQ
jgi:phosphatidylserine/phosphatidylglycerophosphate/cardiolipin synthase-like enzyme